LYFHRRRFLGFDALPPQGKTRAYAASWFPVDDDRDDYPSCHVVAEIDIERRMHIVDCVTAPASLQRAVGTMFNVQDGMHRVAVMQTAYPKRSDIYGIRAWYCPREQAPAVDALIAERLRDLRKRNERISMPISPLPYPFDMDAAARLLQSEIIAGRVLLPKSDLWVSGFLGELCEWPMVRRDARVRAMCVLAQALAEIVPPGRVETLAEKRGSAWAA
jgi:hypothetical protein